MSYNQLPKQMNCKLQLTSLFNASADVHNMNNVTICLITMMAAYTITMYHYSTSTANDELQLWLKRSKLDIVLVILCQLGLHSNRIDLKARSNSIYSFNERESKKRLVIDTFNNNF